VRPSIWTPISEIDIVLGVNSDFGSQTESLTLYFGGRQFLKPIGAQFKVEFLNFEKLLVLIEDS
jgi:hypothetical protein